MSGHNKWSSIKHKKGAADAKRGKAFSKIAKEIQVVARLGGGDPAANPSLRTLIAKGRAVNMPNDNIDRAIKKGTGELEGAALEEVMFEGFAPGGVAVIVQCLTDNRNRTVAEIRNVFNRANSTLAAQGSVLRTFQRKGQLLIKGGSVAEDQLMELVLDAGAEDLRQDGEDFEVITEPAAFDKVVEALTKAGIATESSEVCMLPATYVPVTDKTKAKALLSFVEALEELEDVQNVYSNFDVDAAILEELSKG